MALFVSKHNTCTMSGIDSVQLFCALIINSWMLRTPPRSPLTFSPRRQHRSATLLRCQCSVLHWRHPCNHLNLLYFYVFHLCNTGAIWSIIVHSLNLAKRVGRQVLTVFLTLAQLPHQVSVDSSGHSAGCFIARPKLLPLSRSPLLIGICNRCWRYVIARSSKRVGIIVCGSAAVQSCSTVSYA